MENVIPESRNGAPPLSVSLAWNELLEQYRHHQQTMNRSPRSWQTARSYLNQFLFFLAEQGIDDVCGVTGTTLAGFQSWLFYKSGTRGAVRSVATQNRIISAVKMFFRFLKAEGIIAVDPSICLEYAHEPEVLPRNVLTPMEARKIVETPDKSNAIGYRDRTILEVLYATGIRKAELMNLTVDDVMLEEELLRVRQGKGGRDRMTPLTQTACRFLETYIKAIRPELLQSRQTDRLFISMRGLPIGRNTLGELVVKYGMLAGVKKHVTCHLWRHSCATHLVRNRANLRHVQEMLGHRKLSTTERYLHLTITDLKAAHRKCHPRERKSE
jgi:integrase/recombinase XerD